MLKRRLHPLHRAVADAATARRLRDADASSQQLADALLDRVADLGPSELLPLLHGSPLPAALVWSPQSAVSGKVSYKSYAIVVPCTGYFASKRTQQVGTVIDN